MKEEDGGGGHRKQVHTRERERDRETEREREGKRERPGAQAGGRRPSAYPQEQAHCLLGLHTHTNETVGSYLVTDARALHDQGCKCKRGWHA